MVKNVFYVTMTDKFLSGWGGAKGRKAKYVLECDTYDEALVVLENARNRTDMTGARICSNKPKYDYTSYQVTYVGRKSAPNWYKEGFFGRGDSNG